MNEHCEDSQPNDASQPGGASQPCCAPGRDTQERTTSPQTPLTHAHNARTPHAARPDGSESPHIEITGGTFWMGADDPEGFREDAEGPVREVEVEPFAIDAHALSNARFANFVDDTGYRTEAEKFGWSHVFADYLPEQIRAQSPRAASIPWWAAVDGATWRAPEGPGSTFEGRDDHPVVHVSWNDAQAFCRWAGGRLPSEAEWEFAARGGLVQKRFPWGDELTPDDVHQCNIWQGSFPAHDTGDDGYRGTAPVDAFAPNGYGLFNMAGNVWEWCAVDWRGGKVIRGGSYLCHASYCNRYRVAARTANSADSSSGHAGFRCVYQR